MPPVRSVSKFTLNSKFLADDANVSLELASPSLPLLAQALQDPAGTIPAGEIVLGGIKATAEGTGAVTFGSSQTGKVALKGHAEAAFGVGVYVDAADAIRAIAPSPELADGLALEDPDATRYVVVRAAYDLAGTAKGTIALGAGASGTFGVEGSTNRLFAVLHRFHDAEPAVKVFEDTFGSWAVPRMVDSAEDLAPGTWLITEVDGSMALQLGVQAGYDFSWLREIPDGGLKGDIGLRVQIGASAAFGFEATGKYLVVLAREAADDKLRLRLYKLAKKGWNFALDARVGIKAQLPAFFDRGHDPEDLVAAIFGLNENQIIEVLRETRAFVNTNVSLQDKLAGVLMQLGGKGLDAVAGLSQHEIKNIYEAGRQRVLALLERFDKLLKTGGHELTSIVLSLSNAEVSELKPVLKDIADGGDEAHVQAIVQGLVARAGFERTPIARMIEAAVGSALGAVNNTELARKVRGVAGDVLDLIEGDTLQELLDFIREKVHIDSVKTVVDEASFDRLDNLLKDRLAAFLGKQKPLMQDLQEIQAAIEAVLDKADNFYVIALAAAKKKQEYSFAARYARSTAKTALVDVTFDLSKPGMGVKLQRAIAGDFDDLIVTPANGVTLHTAELTHNISRNVSVELTMPFERMSESASTLSSAKLSIIEDDGRVLLYTLDTVNETSDRLRIFRARSGRDSTLTLAATLPIGVAGGVKIWKNSAFSYSYRMERAVRKMRLSQLVEECEPLVQKYLPGAFSDPQARSFREWAADLDKSLDGKDPNSGTHDIGDTLISLTLTAPPEYLKAWTKAPASRKDPVYKVLSKALQKRLKELVTFYAFSDPARYADLVAAAPAIVFSCLRPTTNVDRSFGGQVEFDRGTDLYWDHRDMKDIRAVVGSPETGLALAQRMKSIADTLRGIPNLAPVAQFYTPDRVDEVVAAALRVHSAGSTVPEVIGSLLLLEDELIHDAVRTGIEMARFRETAAEKPTDAAKHLAQFGEDLASTFNEILGNNPFLSGAARALATLLFVEASAVFDATLQHRTLAALMNIVVVKSGKLSVDEMLAGTITDDVILHEQRFVEI
jgi:hypothetical protein